MKLLKANWFIRCTGEDKYGYATWETDSRIWWIYKYYLRVGNFFKLMCNEKE